MATFVAIAVLLSLIVLGAVLWPLWRDSRALVLGGVLALGLATFALYRITGTPAAIGHVAATEAMPASLDAAIAELRCVMCQNQSLADSNAQIAHDLRREVLDLMNQGKSDAEIKRFLVDRYGEFVLYKPEVSGSTWLLWFGPLILLLAGAAVVFRLVRKRSGVATEVAADDGQEW